MTGFHYHDIKPLTPNGNYSVAVNIASIEKQLEEWRTEHPGGLDLNPDFQRGHVWTEEQQIKFVEYALRGGLSRSGSALLFNCSDWYDECKQPIQIVDGLQRLTAMLGFLRNEIRAFGHYRKDIDGNIRSLGAYFTVHVNNLRTKAEVLRWYLDLNSGGTVHDPEEILRVQKMLDNIDA